MSYSSRRKSSLGKRVNTKGRMKEVSTTRNLYPIHKWRSWYIWKQPQTGFPDEWRAFKEGYIIGSKGLHSLIREVRRIECSAELKNGTNVVDNAS